MKITILSLVLVLLAIGCSKKAGANSPPQFALAAGDLASPPENTTNDNEYLVQIKLSSAKAAELLKFAQQHPGRETDIVVGSRTITEIPMPMKALKMPVVLTIAFDSFEKAEAITEPLKALSR